MGKTRDLCNKIRDTKGTFHAKMITIKDRNCMDLTEAEDTFKRRQEFKVKWALKTSLGTKLVEVMEFQLSYFKSWKMML